MYVTAKKKERATRGDSANRLMRIGAPPGPAETFSSVPKQVIEPTGSLCNSSEFPGLELRPVGGTVRVRSLNGRFLLIGISARTQIGLDRFSLLVVLFLVVQTEYKSKCSFR